MTTEDLQRYHELCIAENWGIGFDRIQRMVETCPTGFWCADIDSKGVVSFCGCYDIGDNTAVVTSYVTDKQYRGKGIGREVFSKAIRNGHTLIGSQFHFHVIIILHTNSYNVRHNVRFRIARR